MTKAPSRKLSSSFLSSFTAGIHEPLALALIASRKVFLAGVTEHPIGSWVTQQARNLAGVLEDEDRTVKFLIRDRDTKFVGPFDEVIDSIGARVIKSPVRAPQANAFAERFIRTVRAECLDWLLVRNERHLERLLVEFIDHYNTGRPHRGIDLEVPVPPVMTSRFDGSARINELTASADSSTSTASPPESTGHALDRDWDPACHHWAQPVATTRGFDGPDVARPTGQSTQLLARVDRIRVIRDRILGLHHSGKGMSLEVFVLEDRPEAFGACMVGTIRSLPSNGRSRSRHRTA
jgi:hypothetical protein